MFSLSSAFLPKEEIVSLKVLDTQKIDAWYQSCCERGLLWEISRRTDQDSFHLPWLPALRIASDFDRHVHGQRVNLN